MISRNVVIFLLGPLLFGQQQSQFQGSVPTGTATTEPLALTLRDAITRGLRTNLGLLVSGSASDAARGERLRSLSALLPQVTGAVTQNEEQINLATFGFNFHFPGIAIPTIVGPFHYTDVRAYGSLSVYDYNLHKNHLAAKENERAAQLSFKDANDLVVQAVAGAYLLVIADSSRVDSLRAQVATDQAIYDRTADQKLAGTAAGIDVLRAQVRIAAAATAIGRAAKSVSQGSACLGARDRVAAWSTIHDRPTRTVFRARRPDSRRSPPYRTAQRADYQSAQATVRAAEASLQAARGERYPNVGITADYGDIGITLANSHGTFTFQAAAKFNIFDGERISGDIIQARAALKQRQDELDDLGGQIDYQVRAALFDIQSATELVTVARSNLDLANQTLEQARDRFTAGVTDNIEVVQAQGSVAIANDNLISALYSHNLAKVELARALGSAEQQLQKFMEVR